MSRTVRKGKGNGSRFSRAIRFIKTFGNKERCEGAEKTDDLGKKNAHVFFVNNSYEGKRGLMYADIEWVN